MCWQRPFTSNAFIENIHAMHGNQVRYKKAFTDMGNNVEDDYWNVSISQLAINDMLKILHIEGFPLKHSLPSNCNQNTVCSHIGGPQHILI